MSATLEVTLRRDVAWPAVALAMTLLLAAALLWRRTRPLAAVTVAFSAVIVVEVVAQATGTTSEIGLGTMAFVLLLGYALYRWGSGRQIVLGSAVVATAFTLGIARDWTSWTETIAAFCFMAAPAVVGLVVRLSFTSRTPHARRGAAARARAAGPRPARHGRPPRLGDRRSAPRPAGWSRRRGPDGGGRRAAR